MVKIKIDNNKTIKIGIWKCMEIFFIGGFFFYLFIVMVKLIIEFLYTLIYLI